jgi:hypothetical protein
MRKIFAILGLAFTFTGCKKELRDSDQQYQQPGESQSKKAPPAYANPAFTFQDYFTQGNRTIPGIFVMDVSGANKTKVFASYTNQLINTPDFPAWSGNGTQLCFTLNSADLYTLNIAIVNGVPVGTNANKIGDGIAASGSYKQGKWRPGQNQIACVWKKTGDPDKIYLLPSAGGSASVLYTAASTDWLIENDIAFKSDGSNLAFSERQISTGFVFLKVFDLSSSQLIKSIDLSQYRSIREIDWAKTPGSNIVAITTVPNCDGTTIGNNGMHQLQTVDVSSASPSLTLLRNDVGNISWSPNDSQITTHAGLGRSCNPATGCCFSQYFDFGIITLATQAYTIPGNNTNYRNRPDWKR